MLLVYRNRGTWGGRGGHVALNILNVNINKYEQRQCNQLAETILFSVVVLAGYYPFTSLRTTGSLCVPEPPPPL